MGAVCCSVGKSGENDDECMPERASGRYSSLNPSRRCSFLLESPRASASDYGLFSKSPVPGSPAANHRRSFGISANMSAEDIAQALQMEYSSPLFSPFLVKVLRSGGNQVHALKAGGPGSEGLSRRGSFNASPMMTSLNCSLDVEAMSTEWPSWQEQRSSNLINFQDLPER